MRPAGRAEKWSWSVGIVLLLSYGGTQLWLDNSTERALASFRHARDSQATDSLDERGNAHAHPAMAPRQLPKLKVGLPDVTSWSSTRRTAFNKVSGTSAEAPVAVLRIDALDMEVPVYEGTAELNLNRGAGWIEGTSRFGEPGNIGLAAHRDGYFRALQRAELGHRVLLETLDTAAEYRITHIQIVAPTAIEVLAPTTRDSVTLVTCYPFYYVGPAPQRFIVKAERIDAALVDAAGS